MKRTLRWVAAATVALAGLAIGIGTLIYIQPLIGDPASANGATYLGALLAGLTAAATLVGVAVRLVRRRRAGAMELVAEAQRSEIAKRMAALNQDQATAMPLVFRSMRGGADAAVDDVIRRLVEAGDRIVLVGRAGSGKSYAATEAALRIAVDDGVRMPVIVPASQWDGRTDVGAWFREYIQRLFNVSPGTSADLIGSQRVLPVIDGLDELEVEEDEASVAEQNFVHALLDWRELARPVPILLTTRLSTWQALPQELRDHHGLSPYQISPVPMGTVSAYISRNLTGQDGSEEAAGLVEHLIKRGFKGVLAVPWSAAMISRIALRARIASGALTEASWERIAATVAADRLVSEFVRASLPSGANLWRSAQCSLDLWRLSRFAKYLVFNLDNRRELKGRILSSRDLQLHRLWPISGRLKPRIVDFLMCVTLSIPGFIWAFPFLWARGIVGQVAITVGCVFWTALLIRTSTKAWVRPATPDWERLKQPKVVFSQLGAALLIGIVATLIISPLVGLASFITAWLAIGLTVGFGQTLTTDNHARVMRPEAVLKHEHMISRLSSVVVLPLLAAGFISTWGLTAGLVSAALYSALVGETVASALWRRYLAMIISSPTRMPLRPGATLWRCRLLGLTRPSGLAYQFRHDDLRDFFAIYSGGPFSWVRSLRAADHQDDPIGR